MDFLAFVDELEKIAIELTDKERHRQYLQFAGLGAAAAPAVSAIQHRIEKGTWMPGANKGKWLAARVVGGALTGGALPIMRHSIERSNLAIARGRARREALARGT